MVEVYRLLGLYALVIGFPEVGPRAGVREYGDFTGTSRLCNKISPALVVGEMWGLRILTRHSIRGNRCTNKVRIAKPLCLVSLKSPDPLLAHLYKMERDN